MAKDVIKYRACFLFAISMFATFTLQAQVNNDKLKKRVIIYKDAMRVDSFLNLLSKQTGVGFSFNSKKISPTKMIAMKKGNYSMADCLAQIQRSSGIHYAMMNNHIILVDNPPQEKYRLTLQAKAPVTKKTITTKPVTRPTVTRSAKSTAAQLPVANKTGAGTTLTSTPSKPDSSKTSSPTRIPDSLTRQTQKLSSTGNDSAINKNNTQKDSIKTVAQRPSATQSRAAAAKARQEAAAAAAETAAAEEKNEAFTATNLMIGAAVLRPDIYDMFGLGVNIQFEKFLGNKVSFTAAAGYHQIFGDYIVGSKLDTAGVPVGDSTAANFAQIPVLLGARYYVVRPFYAAFEAGYTFKASNNVSSYLTFSPSLGVKIPVGDSNIDINIKYLYMNGKTTIPEKTKLEKGNFGCWGLRVAYAFE